jgi:hypothetical protein
MITIIWPISGLESQHVVARPSQLQSCGYMPCGLKILGELRLHNWKIVFERALTPHRLPAYHRVGNILGYHHNRIGRTTATAT